MALEFLNVARIKELSERSKLNERVGELRETYGANIPTYYEFCKANGAEKMSTRQKITRTAVYGAVGGLIGAAAFIVAGPLIAGAAVAVGAVGLGAVAIKTNDRIPAMERKPMRDAFTAYLDNAEAALIKQSEGVLVGAAKAVGEGAKDLAKDTAKGAANLAADGIEGAGRATSNIIKRIVNGKEKTQDFRDMTMTSRAELEAQQAER